MIITEYFVVLETHEEMLYHRTYNQAFEGAVTELINLEFDPECKENPELLKKKTKDAQDVIDHLKGMSITMDDLTPEEFQTWKKIKLEINIKKGDSGVS